MTAKYIDFKSKIPNDRVTGVEDITVEELSHVVQQVALIDVRRPDEWVGDLGHIPEAQLMTLETLPMRIDEIPRDRTVVLICRSGNRSAQAAAFVKSHGLESVFNVQGGMIAWNEKGFNVSRDE